MQDEAELVERAKQNDQEAFTQLYEEYFNKIYRYVVIKIGDRTEAEDMTQQVFIKALQSISSFKWKGVPFSAWLYRIAHNQIVDYLRKNSKKPPTLNEDLPLAGDSGDNPQSIAERNIDIDRLLNATQHLTEAQREVISLRFTSELPTAEVARIMGKSVGAIKALQHSAVIALRKRILVESYE